MTDRPTRAAEQFSTHFKDEWDTLSGRRQQLRGKYAVSSGEVISLLGLIAGSLEQISGVKTSVAKPTLIYDLKNQGFSQRLSIEHPAGNFLVNLEFKGNRVTFRGREYNAADPTDLLRAIAGKAIEHFTRKIPRALD